MWTPRAAARRIASPTIAAVSGPRSKSYCARSSVLPRAVEELGDRRGDLARRLAAVGQSTDRDLRVSSSVSSPPGSARPSTSTATATAPHSCAAGCRPISSRAPTRRVLLVAEAPGYRGTRVSGIPLTSERQLTGRRPGRGDRHDRPRGARASSAWPTTCCSGTSFPPIPATSARTAGRAAPRSRRGCRSRGSSPAAGGSCRRQDRARRARRRPTSAIRLTAARPTSAAASRRSSEA